MKKIMMILKMRDLKILGKNFKVHYIFFIIYFVFIYYYIIIYIYYSMKSYKGGDIVCSLVVIMVIIIVYKFIFKQDTIEGFEWMKETDNNAWKNELVKLFGSKGKKYKGNINVTIDGTECRKWKDGDTESIGVPDIDDEAERLKLLGDKDADVSYCRNIGDKMDTPWCITGPGNGMIIPNITDLFLI